ncbi:hypothetical protein Hanom_Chr06g00525441 [Helianthus anomalus]
MFKANLVQASMSSKNLFQIQHRFTHSHEYHIRNPIVKYLLYRQHLHIKQ